MNKIHLILGLIIALAVLSACTVQPSAHIHEETEMEIVEEQNIEQEITVETISEEEEINLGEVV